MVLALLIVLALLVGCLIVAVGMRRRNRLLVAENERWRALARQRADQIGMLSHELRTPLALVSGAAELLTDGTAGALGEPQQQLVSTIATNAARTIALTDDLLAEARIDAGLFTMRLQTVNLRRLALSVIRDVRQLERTPIRLEARGAPVRVPGDPELLRQVLVNLVNNAVRHAGPSARVTVGLRVGDGVALLSVRDDGAGMSESTRQVLFDRTLEGKSETGHGLGLLISRKIVEMHGGRLLVDSVSDHGTTITVALPDGTSRQED